MAGTKHKKKKLKTPEAQTADLLSKGRTEKFPVALRPMLPH